MEYDYFETDDNLTVIVFSNNTTKTLELYAIKWLFDTSELNFPKLLKIDDQQFFELPGQNGPASNRESAIKIDSKMISDQKSTEKKGRTCVIFWILWMFI